MKSNLTSPGNILSSPGGKGMTVIELSLVLALMVGLASVVVFSASGISDWKLARNASLELRSVYIAQKSYLADHPSERIADVATDDLLPYMPPGYAQIPTCESLEGQMLSINFNVMPPVLGTGHDPSDSTKDGLWDVGVP